jgi:hypothetical protein
LPVGGWKGEILAQNRRRSAWEAFITSLFAFFLGIDASSQVDYCRARSKSSVSRIKIGQAAALNGGLAGSEMKTVL